MSCKPRCGSPWPAMSVAPWTCVPTNRHLRCRPHFGSPWTRQPTNDTFLLVHLHCRPRSGSPWTNQRCDFSPWVLALQTPMCRPWNRGPVGLPQQSYTFSCCVALAGGANNKRPLFPALRVCTQSHDHHQQHHAPHYTPVKHTKHNNHIDHHNYCNRINHIGHTMTHTSNTRHNIQPTHPTHINHQTTTNTHHTTHRTQQP